MPQLPDHVVLRHITTRVIPPVARRAIVACAQWGYGDARNLAGILSAARSFHADPRAVAAAFGFLRDAHEPGSYVDVLTADEFAIALVPKDREVAAAFALSRAVHPEGCSLTAE